MKQLVSDCGTVSLALLGIEIGMENSRPVEAKDKRILWLLNHTTLREFEVPMLRDFGYEIYCPKRFPPNAGNRSASISYDFDDSLSIPDEDRAKLDAFEFYTNRPTPVVQQLLNRHFGTAIVAYMFPMFDHMLRFFHGRILLRAFGLTDPNWTYYSGAKQVSETGFERRLAAVSERFWLAQAYPNLKTIEPPFMQERTLDLPVGLPERVTSQRNTWRGGDRQILFVCPDILAFKESRQVYDDFKAHFGDFDHSICGAQTVPFASDPRVLGRVSSDEYERLYRECEVMFYHSCLPRHVHYHPAEAICYGMPLIYMQAGMLGYLAGRVLPGACQSFQEARAKVSQLLNGDLAFRDEVIDSQKILYHHFSPENNVQQWRKNFIGQAMATPLPKAIVPKCVGVLVLDDQPASMERAVRVSHAIVHAAASHGETVRCHVGVPTSLLKDAAPELSSSVRCRSLQWRQTTADKVRCAQVLQGYGGRLVFDHYCIPQDQVSEFMECDVWLLVGNSVESAVAPIKPTAMLVFDLQRWRQPESHRSIASERAFRTMLQHAHATFCTNPMTLDNVRREASVELDRLLLIDEPAEPNRLRSDERSESGEEIWAVLREMA